MKYESGVGLLSGQETLHGGGRSDEWSGTTEEVTVVFGGDHRDSSGGGGDMKRSIGALRLTVMAYFLISGGPFSIEDIVGAAGTLHLFIFILSRFI
jgi:hypothetical protein